MSNLPLLFSIYAEVMRTEAFEDFEIIDEEYIDTENFEDEIVLGGKFVKAARLVHDQGMVAGSEKGLQELMNRLNGTPKISTCNSTFNKTKIMMVTHRV